MTAKVFAVGTAFSISVLLCLCNPDLIPFVLVGIGLGAAYTFWKAAKAVAVVSACLLALGFCVMALYAFITICPGCGRDHPDYWDVTVTATATYEPAAEAWTVSQTFAVPSRDALQRIVVHADQLSEARVEAMKSAKLARLLLRHIDKDRWSLLAFRNGLPVFQREDQNVAAHVDRLPLHTTLEIPVPDVQVVRDSLYLVAGEGSQLIVNTPEGMLSSTDPAGTHSDVPGGDRWVVPLHGSTFSAQRAHLEAVSPLVRRPPLRSLADISYASAAGWMLMGLVGFVIALFKNQVTAVVDPKVEALLVKLKIRQRPDVANSVLSGEGVAVATPRGAASGGEGLAGADDEAPSIQTPAEENHETNGKVNVNGSDPNLESDTGLNSGTEPHHANDDNDAET